VIDREEFAVAGPLERDVDALACALVATVCQGGQMQLRGGPVQRAQDVLVAGGGEVVIVTGDHPGGPDRHTVRAHDGLMR
jgi:hypothetical protein